MSNAERSEIPETKVQAAKPTFTQLYRIISQHAARLGAERLAFDLGSVAADQEWLSQPKSHPQAAALRQEACNVLQRIKAEQE
jgi:hypothetical protein